MGASGAEGLADLRTLLAALPPDLPVIVMAVLHRSFDSESHLREILQTDCRLPVMVAVNGATLVRGQVWLGEPSRHLRLAAGAQAELVDDPGRTYGNRTIDLLFHSLARWGGGRAIGVILSGSLDDGARGLRAIADSGGLAMTVPPSFETGGMAASAAARVKRLDFEGVPRAIAAEIAQVMAAAGSGAHGWASLG
jgi:two-component system chemotaxis response regulator CheB